MIKRVLYVVVGLLLLAGCRAPDAASPLPSIVGAASPTPATPAPTLPASGQVPSSTASSPPNPTTQSMTGCLIIDGRADAHCTPGALNPAVTQASAGATICRDGWPGRQDPPRSYTDPIKITQRVTYGETDTPLAGLEEDHLISIDLGGDPNSTANLWPQPRTGTRSATTKDAQEARLHAAVCSGALSLADAQAQMLTDWTHT